MPRIKIDYIVSFSSEDKDNLANNLLSWEINKKKWLCKEGEPSASVVLQLAKAVQIESINVGVHHAALIEVLVGLSEKPNEPFEVLVPSCVVVSAAESRRDVPVERTRSFSGDQLGPARARRWDRVRVVCSQPYNKRIKYGLSFVHLRAPEAALPPRLFALDTFSSDEDDFRPGELFARSRAAGALSPATPTTTEAQIRLASSQALQNLNESSTKLIKTPITKPATSRLNDSGSDHAGDRRRENLVYTEDDQRPHDRIDRVVRAHQRQKSNDEQGTSGNQAKKKKLDEGREKLKGGDKKIEDLKSNKKSETNQIDKRKQLVTPTTATTITGKRPATNADATAHAIRADGPVLAGVVFSLSGYENPRRANVRDAAVALGARYEPRDLRRCTHLVCAFLNTPKLRELRQLAPTALAVRAEWVEHSARAAARLPEPPYAPGAPLPPAPDPPLPSTSSAPDSDKEEVDTDDEIMRVVQRRERSGDRSDDTDPYWEGASDDADDTEPDEPPPARAPQQRALPEMFAGDTFLLHERLPESRRALLTRYIHAYGGLVLTRNEDEDCSVSYVVGGEEDGTWGPRGAVHVSPSWVWRCHRKRRRCDAASR